MTKEERVMKQFGKRVSSIRKYRGLTQQEFAEKVDIHYTTVARIELGQRWPKLITLYKMADILEIDVFDFFRKDNKNRLP